MKAAVIGHPISHSLSPAIFRFISQKTGINLSYEKVDVPPENLKSFFEKAAKTFVGLNVTLPHKSSVLKLADELSPECKAIDACNVVKFQNGKAKCFNTDLIGIHESLKEIHFDPTGKSVLLFGSGGVAKTLCYALSKAKNITVVSRKPATELKSLYPKIVLQDFSNPPSGIDLIVNGTPLGMSGVAEPEPATLEFLDSVFQKNPSAQVFDTVYRPKDTLFTNLGQMHGLKISNGLSVLVHQAIATWEIWFGPLDKTQLAAALKYQLNSELKSRPQNIFLNGFMGSGKSTVGQLLAANLNWTFLDTDDLISQSEGTSVPEIFKTKGESYFRDIESQTLQSLKDKKNCVISLGGGAVLDKNNRKLVRQTGETVFLHASSKTLSERLKNQSAGRPLLNTGQDLPNRIDELLKIRNPIYSLSQHFIKTDNLNPEQVTNLILEEFRK